MRCHRPNCTGFLYQVCGLWQSSYYKEFLCVSYCFNHSRGRLAFLIKKTLQHIYCETKGEITKPLHFYKFSTEKLLLLGGIKMSQVLFLMSLQKREQYKQLAEVSTSQLHLTVAVANCVLPPLYGLEKEQQNVSLCASKQEFFNTNTAVIQNLSFLSFSPHFLDPTSHPSQSHVHPVACWLCFFRSDFLFFFVPPLFGFSLQQFCRGVRWLWT